MPTGTSKNATIWNEIKLITTPLCILFCQERSRKVDRNGKTGNKSSHVSSAVMFRSLEMDDVQHKVNYMSLSSDVTHYQWL